MFNVENVYIQGTCQIVSSGYDDRYVVVKSDIVIVIDDIKIRVDHDDYINIYLKLKGIEYSEKAASEAFATKRKGKVLINAQAFYEPTESYQRGRSSVSFNISCTDNLRAGIAVATGFIRSNDEGRQRALEKAKLLSEHEWQFIKNSLDRINEDHIKQGFPTTPVNIPGMK